MTAEQIQKARATHWRQNQDPVLTLEDAQSWLGKIGLCLFLPRRPQIAAPAPSFVEACLGASHATPGREAIETAAELLRRLCDADSAIPLNLLGTPGEQPDFVATPETLPYVFALRGEKDWKREPHIHGAGKVSPLVLEVWRHLEQKGAQPAGEIKDALGREVTEAAVLRALHELWEHLRVIPMPQANGEPALWQPISVRFRKALNEGGNMSQVTALSVLTASYLESSVAATSEEAEAFLSPLASRSRVREVIRGLTATRQLSLLPMDAQTLIYVEGTLPEFEPIPESEALPAPQAERKPFERKRSAFGAKEPGRAEEKPRREAAGRGERSAWKRPAQGERETGTGERPRWKRPEERPGATAGGERPRWKSGEKPSFEKRASSRPSFAKRAGAPAGERPRGEGSPRFGGEKRPWQKREGEAGRGKPFRKGPGAFRADREGGGRAGEGQGRQGGFAPPRRSAGAERPRFERREGDTGKPPFERRPQGEGKPRFERPRSFSDKARGAGQRPDRPRFERREGAAGKPPFARRPQGEGKPRFERPRSFDDKPRGAGQRSDRPRTNRPAEDRAGKREFRERPAGAPNFGRRPGFSKFGKAGSPSASERPGAEPGSAPRRQFGGKPAARFGGKPGAKFSGKPTAKFGSRPGAKFTGKPGGKPGAKFSGKSGGFRGKPGGKFGSKPGGKPGGKPAWKSRKAGRKNDTESGASAE